MGRESYELVIRAGVGSESNPNEPFRYILSRLPGGIKTMNEEPYRGINENALLMARDMVLLTKREMTLKLEVNFD